MFNIVLYNPQIPQNTGNIARTCAVTGCTLHLIKPYGFIINDRTLKRAGLDYWQDVEVYEYDNFEDFLKHNASANIYLVTTKAKASFAQKSYQPNDYFIFGSETAGLPEEIHRMFPEGEIRIPMLGAARCLNLSNSVAVIAYEAFRQIGYEKLH